MLNQQIVTASTQAIIVIGTILLVLVVQLVQNRLRNKRDIQLRNFNLSGYVSKSSANSENSMQLLLLRCTCRLSILKPLMRIEQNRQQMYQFFVELYKQFFQSISMEEQIPIRLDVLGLKCPFSQGAQLLCSTHTCRKPAFICRHHECTCIPQFHEECEFIWIQNVLKKIQKKRRVMSQRLQQATQQIQNVYEQAINRLSRDLSQIRRWKKNYGLNRDEIYFMEALLNDDKQEVTGQLVNRVKSKLHLTNQCYFSDEWIKDFWKNFKNQFNSMFDILRGIPQNYNLELPSKIWKQKQLILEFLGQPVEQFELLYRASQHSFSAQQFHKKCDGKEHTLVIIQTQFNKVIGGYTQLPWKSSQNPDSSADFQKKTFIFSLSLGEKYPIVDQKYAIGHHAKCGPCFGRYGNDIGIVDKANVVPKNIAQFPNRFNNGKHIRSPALTQAFCGATKGVNFRVKEYEVFRVIWKQNKSLRT